MRIRSEVDQFDEEGDCWDRARLDQMVEAIADQNYENGLFPGSIRLVMGR